MTRRKRRKKKYRIRKLLIALLLLVLLFSGLEVLNQRQLLPEQMRPAAEQLLDYSHQFLAFAQKQGGNFYTVLRHRLNLLLSGSQTVDTLSDDAWFSTVSAENELVIDYIDVGQGDCTLIRQGSEAMLFDCAPDDRGTYLQNYLQKLGVSELTYVIGSHPDEDHIGSMDVILEKFRCHSVFMPDYVKDSRSYENVLDALEYEGLSATMPAVGSVYALGNAEFTILGPINHYDDTNNNSIAIRLVYGDTSFLFTGDAETEEENDLIAENVTLRSDVYQAGHHGSYNASSSDFLSAVTPRITIISCGKDNDYGHPNQSTLDRLAAVGSQVLRTDQLGSIRVTSDGSTLQYLSR